MSVSDMTTTHVVTFNHFCFLKLLPVSVSVSYVSICWYFRCHSLFTLPSVHIIRHLRKMLFIFETPNTVIVLHITGLKILSNSSYIALLCSGTWTNHYFLLSAIDNTVLNSFSLWKGLVESILIHQEYGS
jgi:hypothetical protein